MTYLFAVFIKRKRRKLSAVIKILALTSLICILWGPAPRLLLQWTQSFERFENPKWSDSNIIVVLGGGSSIWPDEKITPQNEALPRVLEALRLYQLCINSRNSCSLLLSGGNPRKIKISEAEAMKETFLSMGVPASDIILESKSNDTEQNAQFSAEILKKYRYDQLVLVTSGYHMKRALNWFKYEKLKPLPAPADYIEVRSNPWPRG